MSRTFAGPGPFFFSALLLVMAVGCDERSLCDQGRLQDRLRSAASGTTVRMGRCRIEGANLMVPEGVGLEGDEGSELVGRGDAPVVELAEGATLQRVRVVTQGSIGVRATGADTRIADIVVELQRGIGIALRSDRAMLRDIRIEGPDDGETFPPFADPDEGAYGIVVLDSTGVDIANLDIVQAGPWGAVIANTTLTWNGGEVSEGVGTAIYADGGSVQLDDVVIRDVVQGLQPLPAYGAVFTNGTMAITNRLQVSDADLGVLHDGASGTHTDLNAATNIYGGAWVQRSDDVSFAGGSFDANGVAGIASVASSNITIDGASITNSVAQTTVFGELGAVEAGDGIQITAPVGRTTIRQVTLATHARIGVLLDLSDMADLPDVSLIDVEVTGEALGCLAQSLETLIPLGGWDDGVTRIGTVLTNDTAQVDALLLGGALSEGNLPGIDTSGLGL